MSFLLSTTSGFHQEQIFCWMLFFLAYALWLHLSLQVFYVRYYKKKPLVSDPALLQCCCYSFFFLLFFSLLLICQWCSWTNCVYSWFTSVYHYASLSSFLLCLSSYLLCLRLISQKPPQVSIIYWSAVIG